MTKDNTVITVVINKKLLKEADQEAKLLYSNRSNFIRNAIRESINRNKKARKQA